MGLLRCYIALRRHRKCALSYGLSCIYPFLEFVSHLVAFVLHLIALFLWFQTQKFFRGAESKSFTCVVHNLFRPVQSTGLKILLEFFFVSFRYTTVKAEQLWYSFRKKFRQRGKRKK